MPLPTGIILLWQGSIASIPSGFILCDGGGGSPDLRDRFIIGAGTTFNPDDTGGNSSHTHSFSTTGHTHTIPIGTGIQGGAGRTTDAAITGDTGTTDAGSSLPPYYALAYIMKT